jgi:histidine triad (HIT) family protein
MSPSHATIFERILAGEIPCKKVFEDEHTLAFHDIAPQAPVHVLVIPKTRIINVAHAAEEHAQTLGRVLLTARTVAQILGIEESGYRLVFNNGSNGGQTVDYLHCHVLGGRPLRWPPG